MRKKRTIPERDALYLEDIYASALLIEAYLKGVKQVDFMAATSGGAEKADAVSRRLIVIGEAVKSLSELMQVNLRKTHPDIAWSDIARLKDKLTHHYWTIDIAQIWEIAKVHVPILKRAIAPTVRGTKR